MELSPLQDNHLHHFPKQPELGQEGGSLRLFASSHQPQGTKPISTSIHTGKSAILDMEREGNEGAPCISLLVS